MLHHTSGTPLEKFLYPVADSYTAPGVLQQTVSLHTQCSISVPSCIRLDAVSKENNISSSTGGLLQILPKREEWEGNQFQIFNSHSAVHCIQPLLQK